LDYDKIIENLKKTAPAIRCSGCDRIISQSVIEKGFQYIKCSNCGNDNIILSTGIVKQRIIEKGINPLAKFINLIIK
jgi:ribosomal protein S27E